MIVRCSATAGAWLKCVAHHSFRSVFKARRDLLVCRRALNKKKRGAVEEMPDGQISKDPLPRALSRLSQPRLSFRPPRPTLVRDGVAAVVNSLRPGGRRCQTAYLSNLEIASAR